MDFVDSLANSSDLYTPISKIAENTEPLNLITWNLSWWSFLIAILSLIAGVIAAIYSYKGYIFQRLSADRLEKLIPGQISYFEVACCLVNIIFDLEALFFGTSSYKTYPVKLILLVSKLPDDLIVLEKYEKNKTCYDEAFRLKLAWRDYNVFLDNFIKEIDNFNEKEISSYAENLMNISKSMILQIQKFEDLLSDNGILKSKHSTNERIAYFILDRFFEFVSDINSFGLNHLDTKRTNITKKSSANYLRCPYIPNLINFDTYLNSYHFIRLNMIRREENIANDRMGIHETYNDIKTGKYNRLGDFIILPPNHTFASIEIHEFKNAYFNYIEPIILGYKRYEYSHFLKSKETI